MQKETCKIFLMYFSQGELLFQISDMSSVFVLFLMDTRKRYLYGKNKRENVEQIRSIMCATILSPVRNRKSHQIFLLDSMGRALLGRRSKLILVYSLLVIDKYLECLKEHSHCLPDLDI